MNSRRAGLDTGFVPAPRDKSQEAIAERAAQRISASREQAAKRTSEATRSESVSSNFPNSQPSTIDTSIMPDNVLTAHLRKMPKPGEKNAPSFDPEKPEELGRFFDRIEDWYNDEGITDDPEKKKRIVKYLDADSEIQWKAFSKFSDGTYTEFKSQVMASYPKAEEVMKGSVAALKRKINRIGPVAADDRDELLSLIRVVTAEVAKLKKITPPIHTNRELVGLFLNRLTPDFARRVADKLAMRRLIPRSEQDKGDDDRNPEDMFDIEEVMEMAKHTSMESANPFGRFLWANPSGPSESSVKLEEAVARLTDSISLQAKQNQLMDQKLSSLQSFMSQPRPIPTGVPQNGAYASRPGWERGLAPTSNHVHAAAQEGCFYCKGDHRINDCEHMLRHLDLKIIKKVDGRLRMADGSRLIRDGIKTMKEIVEALHKKNSVIPMSKIPDKASLYQEGVSRSSYTQMQTMSPENVEIRSLVEMIQRIGVNRVQQLIDGCEEIIEDDEFDPNFD